MGSARKVLIADDDASGSATLARYLGVRGWASEVLASGSELFHRGTAGADVLILDMRLPDASGIEILSELRGRGDDIAVVIVSGFLDARSTIDAMRLGALDVLEKPVDTRYLEELLRRSSDRRSDIPAAHVASPLVGSSRPMQILREQIVKVAGFRDLPVMVIGESGTGKELVARALHELGGPSRPLVAINCAAMPETLFESELFGHASGAFTGAKGSHAGLLEAAGSGTVFLDEVAEMPAPLQAKLLRVLETRRYRRVGASEDFPLRARIVSATNRRVRGAPTDALRPDLYFRLAGYTILTPPLRTRLHDVEELAEHFLAAFRSKHADAPTRLSREAIEALRSHDWPGNVRELRAVLQSAAVCAETDLIGVRHVVQAMHSRGHWRMTPPEGIPPLRAPVTDVPSADASRPEEHSRVTGRRSSGASPVVADSAPEPQERRRASGVRLAAMTDLPELERELILRVMGECNGNLSEAARKLNIPRTTLRDKLRRFQPP